MTYGKNRTLMKTKVPTSAILESTVYTNLTLYLNQRQTTLLNLLEIKYNTWNLNSKEINLLVLRDGASRLPFWISLRLQMLKLQLLVQLNLVLLKPKWLLTWVIYLLNSRKDLATYSLTKHSILLNSDSKLKIAKKYKNKLELRSSEVWLSLNTLKKKWMKISCHWKFN